MQTLPLEQANAGFWLGRFLHLLCTCVNDRQEVQTRENHDHRAQRPAVFAGDVQGEIYVS